MTSKKELSKYTWGFGIEHEMHIFHKPIHSDKAIKDFTIFDSYKIVEKMLEEKNNSVSDISYDDYMFLKNIPFETSGRKCNDQWVIKTVPVKMPEFITFDPFCSIKKGRDLKNMTKDIVFAKERFYNLLLRNKETHKLIKKYGDFAEYPFGMTRYLKCPIEEKNGTYFFEKDKKGKDILLPEYNGSYHMTMTLPHKEDITNKEFIKIHKNFCNQLQWLEPLMLTAYFSGDENAPGTLKKIVRGSFRVMIIGWGNFAGSDIRLLDKGIGRYAKTPTYWRDNLYFDDVYKLRPCYKPSPMAKREGAISSLSSDFRTFGSTDPDRPWHRESGVGMSKPNGVEFRIFDQFNDKYIEHLAELIALVGENSRVQQTRGYVYENKVWISELHNIMNNGYKAQISKKYINLLRKKLGLKINTTSIIAIDIFKQIYKELWDKNIDGDWCRIFHCDVKPKYENVIFPDANKRAWQFAFMLKLNRNPKLMHKFNFLTKYLNNVRKINFEDFEIAILEIFGKNWINDIVDIAYFYKQDNKNIKLIKNKNGTIKKLIFEGDYELPLFDNFNDLIIDSFGSNLRNIL